MTYKETINQFLSTRYSYLTQCANNILKYNLELEAHDLIAELVIYMHDNQSKVQEYVEMGKLEAFCVSWMNIQGRYASSPTNKKYASNTTTLDAYNQDNLTIEEDIIIDQDEYTADLATIYTDEQIRKIMSVSDILDKLDNIDKLLFQAYFMEGLSYDGVRKKYTFFKVVNGKEIKYKSRTSIHNMVTNLKAKIIYLINESKC